MKIAIIVLTPFLPKIKGFFGEKSVGFFLSHLNQTKHIKENKKFHVKAIKAKLRKGIRLIMAFVQNEEGPSF